MATRRLTRRDLLKTAGVSAVAIAIGGSPSCVVLSTANKSDKKKFTQAQTHDSSLTMPDTLDLAQRAELSLHALTGALDADYGYELYFFVQFCQKPPVMIHESTGLPTNNPKFAEAQAMMRVMSGSNYNLDIQQEMMNSMLRNVHADGLYYSPLERRPWSHEGGLAVGGIAKPFANVYGNGRLLLAMMAWSQWDKNPAWEERMQRQADALVRIAIDKGDYAYYPVGRGVGEQHSFTPDGWAETEEPKDGGFGVPMYHSGVIRALAGWYEMSGDRKALAMAGKLTNYLRRPFVWTAEVEPKAINGSQHGHCNGHFHAHAAALRGLLAYGIAVQDPDLLLFVRDGYEWLRNYGVSRIGWFPENLSNVNQHCESCCIGDMVPLAIRLSQVGIGDYWDDVDRYVRNQLVEQQLTRKDYLEKLAENSPVKSVQPPRETSDRVIERNLGGFVGHGDLTLLPNTWIMHCCTGNGAPALYYAWDSILQSQGNFTTVNLLLNRLSPQLDVYSYLPYQGRAVLHNRTSRIIAIRIPAWVNRKDVKCSIGDRHLEAVWSGQYLLVENLNDGEAVTVEFPIKEHTEKFIHYDKEYTALFKGNTVIDLSPKQDGIGYPIYERAQFRTTEAPSRLLPRHVAKEVLKWV